MSRLAVAATVAIAIVACRDATVDDPTGTLEVPAFAAVSVEACAVASDAARDAAQVYRSSVQRVRSSGPSAVGDVATAFAALAQRHTELIAACVGGTPYTVGGTVSGLTVGRSVTLRNNGGADLVVSANGPFTFALPVADGGAYAVTVATQPVGGSCSVSSGSGTIAGANVTNVSVACVAAVAPNVGDLLITEIMVDPLAVTDANGEYFEILNTTSNPIELQGLQVRDDANTGFTIATSLVVAPNGFVVLGVNGSVATNGGVIVNYVYTGFSLTNTSDQIELRSGATVLDRVAYGVGFPLLAGHAMVLSQSSLDPLLNDISTNWCSATLLMPGGDFGTPGTGSSCP